MPGIKSRCEALEMDNTWLRDSIHVLNTQVVLYVYVCVCVCVSVCVCVCVYVCVCGPSC